MAEFLTTKGITHYLDKIIDDAQKELVLISPYIKADETTKDLLKNKTRATSINVIYGKAELKPSEKSFLDSLGIKTSFIENLHAKCYLNEDHALLTSMNLYQFSQEHNDEMGILVSREDDAELYGAIYRQAMRWKTASSAVQVAENSTAYSVATGARTKPQPTLEKPKGFLHPLQRLAYQPIRNVRTVRNATRVGIDTRTPRTRRSIATPVGGNRRRPYASPCVPPAIRSTRTSSRS